MDKSKYFIDFSKITDEDIQKAKENKKDSEYTTKDLVDDLTREDK